LEKYVDISALEMAGPGNQHCANCIGTLSSPTDGKHVYMYGEQRTQEDGSSCDMAPNCSSEAEIRTDKKVRCGALSQPARVVYQSADFYSGLTGATVASQ